MSTDTIFSAAINGQFAKLKKLLKEGVDVNSVSAGGKTPLMYAVSSNNKKTVELLIKNGATVNSTDDNNQNALHRTFLESHFEMARILLQNGADSGARTKEGKSILELAIKRKNTKLILLLTKYAQRLDEDDQRKIKLKFKAQFNHYA